MPTMRGAGGERTFSRRLHADRGNERGGSRK